MAAYQKRIHARVSLPDGQFLKVWEDFQFRGFSKELNGGLSECVLTIGRAFDYDENDVAEGNDVQLIVADRDTTDDDGDHDGMGARIIYRGYI